MTEIQGLPTVPALSIVDWSQPGKFGSVKAQNFVQDGFIPANPTIGKRVVINVDGIQKSGKTHFGLTAPGAIFVQSIDVGLEGVVDKFTSQKQVFVETYRYTVGEADSGEYKITRRKFESDFRKALQIPYIKTIIWDTATEVWELFRLAEFGRVSSIPTAYGALNAQFRDLIREALEQSNTNLILLNKMKDEWVGNVSTGNVIAAGFKDLRYLAQVNVTTFRNTAGKGDNGNITTFGVRIDDCRFNPNLNGRIYMQPMNIFPCVASALFPDTVPQDWV